MPDMDIVYAVIGIAVAVLAAAAAWIEVRSARREEPPHHKVLKSDPHYKQHRERRR